MLFPIAIILIICGFLKQKKDLEVYFVLLTIVFSVFFFSSKDPFVKIPMYFYFMLISIFVGYAKNKFTFSKFSFLSICSIIIFMIIPIVFISLGINQIPVLLITKSVTETLNISGQLFFPIADFTVFKHFIFYICFLLFIDANKNIFKSCVDLNYIKKYLYLFFKILIVCIILEGAFVNLTDFNDRPLMSQIFNLGTLNQAYNWETWGVKSVAFCFPERSYFNCIAIFYLLQIKKSEYNQTDFIFYVLSIVALYFTGSSATLIVTILFGLVIFINKLITNKNQIIVLESFLLVFVVGIVMVTFNSILFGKIQDFLLGTEKWNSSYFRHQSIELGVSAICNSPIFGIGIGTVYTHSSLIQTVANIGIAGFILLLYFIVKNLEVKMSKMNVLLIIIILLCMSGTYLLEEITSPFFIAFFIPLASEEASVYKYAPNKLVLLKEKNHCNYFK